MVDFDFGLSRSMGKGIIRCLCSVCDLSFFFKGEVGIASFAIRRNSKRRLLLFMLTKRASNLVRSLVLAFEKLKRQSGVTDVDRRRLLLKFTFY